MCLYRFRALKEIVLVCWKLFVDFVIGMRVDKRECGGEDSGDVHMVGKGAAPQPSGGVENPSDSQGG